MNITEVLHKLDKMYTIQKIIYLSDNYSNFYTNINKLKRIHLINIVDICLLDHKIANYKPVMVRFFNSNIKSDTVIIYF